MGGDDRQLILGKTAWDRRTKNKGGGVMGTPYRQISLGCDCTGLKAEVKIKIISKYSFVGQINRRSTNMKNSGNDSCAPPPTPIS